ncbi:kinase-like domain-containing protein [Nemania diffusa]|nr:kinase-like domain-containing protein [Nemania diffusa]
MTDASETDHVAPATTLVLNGLSVKFPTDKHPEYIVSDILLEKCHPKRDFSGFLPYSALVGTITKEVIQIILERSAKPISREELDEVTARVLHNDPQQCMIKIFAILIINGMTVYIRQFIDAGITDKDLPFPPVPDLYQRLEFIKSQRQKYNIYTDQWLVHVPVLDLTANQMEVVPYSSDIRMPFLENSARPKGQGGQGKVNEIRIHPDHFHGPPLEGRFALKRMSLDSRSRWENEVDALNGFRGPQRSGHENVIKLLLAYEHVGKGLYMVFPLARGDLADYWELNSTHSPSPEDALWFIQQCTDLTSALRKIHYHPSLPKQNHGRHGDIKPENILWFQNGTEPRGRLVVADLTMMRYHSEETVNDTTFKGRGITKTYRAPEYEVQVRTQDSQAYDVWSLGCVFLEFMVWYLLGYPAARHRYEYRDHQGESCQSFARARINDEDGLINCYEDKFFNIIPSTSGYNHTAVVKTSVQKWAQRLHYSPLCSMAMHDFLDLIMTHMIVIEPAKRITMAQVNIDLKDILNKCSQPAYYHQGAPRPIPDMDYGPLEFPKSSKRLQSPTLSLHCPVCLKHGHEQDDHESEVDKKVGDLFKDVDESESISTDAKDAHQAQASLDQNSTPAFSQPPTVIRNVEASADTVKRTPRESEAFDESILDKNAPSTLLRNVALQTPSKGENSDIVPHHESLRLSIRSPSTVITSYLQSPSDVSSMTRRRSRSTMNTADQSFNDQQDDLLRGAGFPDPNTDHKDRRKLDDDSVFNAGESDGQDKDPTRDTAAEDTRNRPSTMESFDKANADKLNKKLSRNRYSRKPGRWKSRIRASFKRLYGKVRDMMCMNLF